MAGKGKKNQSKAHAPEPNPVGRPSAYKPEFAKQAAKLCLLGATDADLADFFSVTIQTINNWKSKHPEFGQSLVMGKNEADDRVERSLYQRALGYEYDAEKIFNANGSPLKVPYREKCPPDTTAIQFWLKNRRPEQWRDIQRHEHGNPGDFSKLSDEELNEVILSGYETLEGLEKEGTKH